MCVGVPREIENNAHQLISCPCAGGGPAVTSGLRRRRKGPGLVRQLVETWGLPLPGPRASRVDLIGSTKIHGPAATLRQKGRQA